MTKHTGTYLKPARRVTVPSVVFTVVVETAEIPNRNTNVYSEKIFKSAIATVTKRRNGKWSKPKIIEANTPAELRNWIHLHADTRRRNYIVCPIASDVLTLTHWWNHVESAGVSFERRDSNGEGIASGTGTVQGYSVRRIILRGRPDIFDYTFESKRYIWLSGTQFVDSGIDKLANAVGFGRGEGMFPGRDFGSIPASAEEIAIIWSQLFCHLSNWWSEVATAPFGLTVGSLAMGILRSHIKPKALSTHKDEYVHKLERSACYGGRSSLWFVGSVGNAPVLPIHGTQDDRRRDLQRLSGPARLIDVRSMYPYLLASHLFPCKISGRIGTVSPSDLHSLCGHYGVIASVTIRAKNAEYPKRGKHRLNYPTGQFQTVLTGPEIQSIQPPDELIAVHDGALYTMGRPFQDAAQTLLDMRVQARDSKNPAWELFAKSVGNNLGGKLAQRRTRLKPRPDIYPERNWGEWIVSDSSKGVSCRFRATCGLVEEFVKDEGGYGPYTPAFAYLTAYGRLMMRSLREKCEPFSVVSQDTDGIWIVGDSAYESLCKVASFGDSPGQMQVKDETESFVAMSPRHYYTDKGWTLAGFTSDKLDVQTMQVQDTFMQNPVTSGTRETPRTLITKSRLSSLVIEHCGGEIDPYGWVRPIYIPPPLD